MTRLPMSAGEVRIRAATPDDRLPIFRMLELYQYELSDMWDQDIDQRGEYGYALDRYWSAGQCHAFIATVNGKFAGFALVDAAVKLGDVGHWMDQFFVLKKYRRAGVGQAMARVVFEALPGAWEVGQMLLNMPARRFWHKVIGEYTAGDFVEHKLQGSGWEGYVQCFRSALRQPEPVLSLKAEPSLTTMHIPTGGPVMRPHAVANRPLQTYQGSCHCGAVRFEIESDFPELTMCDCSICRRKNALMVKVHESKFRLLAGEDSLTEYQFHTGTARHYFCKTCGIYPFHRKRVTPDTLGINVFCLHDFEPADIPVRRAQGAAMP